MNVSFSERKTRVVTLTNDSYGSVDTVANFLYRGFHTKRCETKEVVRRDVEALWKCQCPAACAKKRREPSLLAMMLMPWAHGHSGDEHGPHTLCDPMCLFVASLAYLHVLRQGRGRT